MKAEVARIKAIQERLAKCQQEIRVRTNKLIVKFTNKKSDGEGSY